MRKEVKGQINEKKIKKTKRSNSGTLKETKRKKEGNREKTVSKCI